MSPKFWPLAVYCIMKVALQEEQKGKGEKEREKEEKLVFRNA